MDFKQFIGKKVILSAMSNLQIEGMVTGIVDMHKCDNCSGDCAEPWMQVLLDSSSRNLDSRIALVDCNMITCIVDVS